MLNLLAVKDVLKMRLIKLVTRQCPEVSAVSASGNISVGCELAFRNINRHKNVLFYEIYLASAFHPLFSPSRSLARHQISAAPCFRRVWRSSASTRPFNNPRAFLSRHSSGQHRFRHRRKNSIFSNCFHFSRCTC